MGQFGGQPVIEGPAQTQSMIMQPTYPTGEGSGYGKSSGSSSGGSKDKYPELKGLEGENIAHMQNYLMLQSEERDLRNQMYQYLVENNNKIDPQYWQEIQSKREDIKYQKAILKSQEQGLINRKAQAVETVKNVNEYKGQPMMNPDGSLMTMGDYMMMEGAKESDLANLKPEVLSQIISTDELPSILESSSRVPDYLLNYRHVDVPKYQKKIDDAMNSVKGILTKDVNDIGIKLGLMEKIMNNEITDGQILTTGFVKEDNIRALRNMANKLKQDMNDDPEFARTFNYMYQRYKAIPEEGKKKLSYDDFINNRMNTAVQAYSDYDLKTYEVLNKNAERAQKKRNMMITKIKNGEFVTGNMNAQVSGSEREFTFNTDVMNEFVDALIDPTIQNLPSASDAYTAAAYLNLKNEYNEWLESNPTADIEMKRKKAIDLGLSKIDEIQGLKDVDSGWMNDFVQFHVKYLRSALGKTATDGKEITIEEQNIKFTNLNTEIAKDFYTFEVGKPVIDMGNRNVKMAGMQWTTFNDIPLLKNGFIVGQSKYLHDVIRMENGEKLPPEDAILINIAVPKTELESWKENGVLDYYYDENNFGTSEFNKDVSDLDDEDLAQLGIVNYGIDGTDIQKIIKRSDIGQTGVEYVIIQVAAEYLESDYQNDMATKLNKEKENTSYTGPSYQETTESSYIGGMGANK